MEKVTVFKVIHQTINHCTGEKTSFVYNMFARKEDAKVWMDNMFRKLISMKKRGKVYETHDEEWVILSKEKKDIFTIIETKE
jgi:hypothetical protein